jgi:hypothetical protein
MSWYDADCLTQTTSRSRFVVSPENETALSGFQAAVDPSLARASLRDAIDLKVGRRISVGI